MIEVVGNDGVIYHVDVRFPAGEVTNHFSDVEQRFLQILEDMRFDQQPLKRAPRIIQVQKYEQRS